MHACRNPMLTRTHHLLSGFYEDFSTDMVEWVENSFGRGGARLLQSDAAPMPPMVATGLRCDGLAMRLHACDAHSDMHSCDAHTDMNACLRRHEIVSCCVMLCCHVVSCCALLIMSIDSSSRSVLALVKRVESCGPSRSRLSSSEWALACQRWTSLLCTPTRSFLPRLV